MMNDELTQLVVQNFDLTELVKEMDGWVKEFEVTQPRKKRGNLIGALERRRKGEPLNKYQTEAMELFGEFVVKKCLG